MAAYDPNRKSRGVSHAPSRPFWIVVVVVFASIIIGMTFGILTCYAPSPTVSLPPVTAVYWSERGFTPNLNP